MTDHDKILTAVTMIKIADDQLENALAEMPSTPDIVLDQAARATRRALQETAVALKILRDLLN